MVYGVMTAGNMSAAVTLTMSVVIVCLARIFHDKAGVRHAYLAGIALACAAMAWPYVLALLPVLLFFLIKPQEAFSLRNVAAMLLGILTPGWIYLPYWLYVHLKAMDWMLLAEPNAVLNKKESGKVSPSSMTMPTTQLRSRQP